MDETMGGWRKLHNEELHNLHFSQNNKNEIVKKDEVVRAYSTHVGEEKMQMHTHIGE
jgi:hypothetical protein